MTGIPRFPKMSWEGSRTKIINNNYYGSSYGRNRGCNFGFFNYSNHCCNNSYSTPKWMNWMMGLGMGTTFLGGILRMFGVGNNEGAGGKAIERTNLQTTNQNTTQTAVNDKLAAAQNSLKQLGLTGYTALQDANGNIYYTDGKNTAKTLQELINLSKKTESTLVNREEKEQQADNVEEVNTEEVETHSTQYRAENKTKFSMPKLPENIDWKRYNQLSEVDKKKFTVEMTVDDLVKKLLNNSKNKKQIEEFKTWIINGNPTAIKDGKIVNLNKLDLPVYNTSVEKEAKIKVINDYINNPPKNELPDYTAEFNEYVKKHEDKLN